MRRLRHIGMLAWMAALLLPGCASLPPPPDKPASTAMVATHDDGLGHIARQSVPAGSTSAFRPLATSDSSMDARLTLARHAQRSLDLQYYLLQNDGTGRRLLREVRDAALRGVRVRLLVDDLYTADSDRLLLGLSAYPNVQVRLFNPFPAGRAFSATRWMFSLFDFARVNHRMHNKLFIADGAFAVAGGRNIADEYFFHSERGDFIDFDLLLAGDAVPAMQAVFDRYWNSRQAWPLQALEKPVSDPAYWRAQFDRAVGVEPQAGELQLRAGADRDLLGYRPLSVDLDRPPLDMLGGDVQVFADLPDKVSGRSAQGDDPSTVTSQVIAALDTARSNLLLVSPYFIPGSNGLAVLQRARDRGVHVEVVTNSVAANDEPFASAAYARYRRPLLKMGVELFEISSGQLHHDDHFSHLLHRAVGRSHAKLVVIDQRRVFVGSMNMDLRSSRVNTELGLIIDSPALARSVDMLADYIRSAGTYRLALTGPDRDDIEWLSAGADGVQSLDREPELGLGTRLQLWFVAPFISESLL